MTANVPKDYYYHNGVKRSTIAKVEGPSNARVASYIDTIKVDGTIRYLTKPAFEIHVYAPQANKPSWRGMGATATLTYDWVPAGNYWRVWSRTAINGYIRPNSGGPTQNAVTKVVAINLQGIASMQEMFLTFRNMTSFEVSESVITSHITSFQSTFNGCNKLTHVDYMNTSSCIDFFDMYQSCYEIQSIPRVDSSRPCDFQRMYQNCRKLNCIGGVDTSHMAGTMSKRWMFDGCTSLSAPRKVGGQAQLKSASGFNYVNDQCPNINYDVNMFVTSVARPKVSMNGGTPIYTEYTPGVWRVTSTGNVMHISFQDEPDNISVTKIDIRRAKSLTFFGSSFRKCPNLVEIKFGTGVTNNIGTMADAFKDCRNLEKIVGLNLDSATTLDRAFYDCGKLGHLERSTTAPKLKTAVSAFENCTLVTGATLQTPILQNASSMYKNSGVVSINNHPYPLLNTAPAMFQDCKELITVPALNLPELVTANSMFRNCPKLKSVSNMIVPKLSVAGAMFTQCPELLAISAISMPEVTVANSICSGNKKLESSLLSGFGKCTNFGSMYENCYVLTTIGDIDYIAATTMWSMFKDCRSMKSYKRINSEVCTNFANLFYGNWELLCLTSLDTNMQTVTTSMFGNAPKLVVPDAFTMADLTSGSDFTNPDPCPIP